MILSTFDKELYEKDLKEEGIEIGERNCIRKLVAYQLTQGKTAEEISELFGETLELIEVTVKQIKES